MEEKWNKKLEAKFGKEIHSNPAVLYKYARKKAVLRTNIGPLKKDDKTLTSNSKEMADILMSQYSGVSSTPRNDIYDKKFREKLFTKDGGDIFIDP